ncbi:MAG TPA: hypothetical protein VMZ53_05415 [Kofleriaceae bacterium]|nr:hypothetical protein [Kofleriaceae bacterium]
MKTTTTLLALLIALAACGDNKGRPDARQPPDGPPADAQCSNCPAAPALGTQIDRMGRPAINTLLNHGFDPGTGAGPAKNAYNADTMPSTWPATYLAEFKKNLGVLDALDTGFCGNGRCELGEFGTAGATGVCAADCATATQVGTGDGCGNQVLYNGGMGTTPALTSYDTLSSILAADELYVDTSKSTCAFYLAVEFGVATGLGNSTCGGRAPQYDVIDFSLSAIAVGINGFSTDGLFTPKMKDNAPAHTDYTSTFPFLGEPNDLP